MYYPYKLKTVRNVSELAFFTISLIMFAVNILLSVAIWLRVENMAVSVQSALEGVELLSGKM